MESLRSYRVSGVERETRQDVELVVSAASEANAKVKAELAGIVVTGIRIEPEAVKTITNTVLDTKPAMAGGAPTQTTVVEPSRTSSWSSSVALALTWVVLAVAALIAIGQVSGSPSLTSARPVTFAELLGYVVGANVFSATGLVLSSFVFFASRRTAGRSALLTAIILVVITTALSGYHRLSTSTYSTHRRTDEADARRAVADIAATVKTLTGDPEGRSQPPAGDSGAGHGAFGQLVSITTDLANGMAADTKHYQSEMAKLRFERMLLPEQLDSRADIEESLKAMVVGRALLAAYKSKSEERMEKAKAAMGSMSMPAATRDEVIAGFNKTFPDSWARAMTSFRYEETAYDEMEFLLQYLLSKSNAFEASASGLLFQSETDLEEYNASLKRLAAIGAKTMDLRARVQSARTDLLRAAENVASGSSWPGSAEKVKHVGVVDVVVDKDKCLLNGISVFFPAPTQQLTDLIGPHSLVQSTGGVWKWPEIDMVGYLAPTGESVRGIALTINPMDPSEQRSGFAGSLTINGTPVTDVDSPRSLNRRFSASSGFSLKATGAGKWRGQIGLLRLEVLENEQGLCGVVAISLAADEELPLIEPKPHK